MYLPCNLRCRSTLGTMINITRRVRIMPRISLQIRFHGNNWSEIESHKAYCLGTLEHLDPSNQGWWFKTPWTWESNPKPVWGGSYTWVVEKWGKVWSGIEPGVSKDEWRNTPPPTQSHFFPSILSHVLPTKSQTQLSPSIFLFKQSIHVQPRIL